MEKKFSNIRMFLQQRGISLKNLALWLIAAAVVISAAFLFGGLAAGKNQVFPVRISEIMADNSLYPNSDGLCCDYIEVYNSADYPVDLGGFQLGDVAGKSRYVFPSGTLLQPGEYLTVYCNKTANSPEYAPFEINRAGGESFYLIARNGAVVDRVTTVTMKADQVMLPQGDALVLGRDFTRSNYAYKKGVADPVFASTKDLIQYTNVLVGFSLDQCKDDIAMRPYIILEDAAGNQITLYGGTIYRSIGYIAYQNRTVFKPKTASYNYVWEIIHHVYGDKYDADYKGQK